ncbi:MAG: chemotaxis protein CheW [Spirochaetia bacterium]|nr:chemotaxis protein CheW [Spirochaetia bacterium]
MNGKNFDLTEGRDQKKIQQAKGSSDIVQIIIFSVGNEDYGLEIEKIQEVIRMRTIKHLPHTPEFILGVMNLRGNIIPVVGLREKFGMPPVDYTEFTRVIVVKHKNKLVGMVVDEVNRVVNVPIDKIDGNPDMVSDTTRALVRGVANIDDQVIILVELDYLLFSVDEIQTDMG